MPQPIVFVGGVHGSGKSTLSRYLAAALPATYVTAGGLIREAASADHVVTVGAQDKVVPDVDANQAVLLRGLSAFQARTSDDPRPLLLDGHFTLMNPEGEFVEVPFEVFAGMAPVAVLLVEADAAVVHRRLADRAPTNRDLVEARWRRKGSAVAISNDCGGPTYRQPVRLREIDGTIKTIMKVCSSEKHPEKPDMRPFMVERIFNRLYGWANQWIPSRHRRFGDTCRSYVPLVRSIRLVHLQADAPRRACRGVVAPERARGFRNRQPFICSRQPTV